MIYVLVGTFKNGVRTADKFHTERDVASNWTVLSGAISEFNACAFYCYTYCFVCKVTSAEMRSLIYMLIDCR